MNFKHKATKKLEYATWSAMRSRCNNPKASNFHLYGGRGIKICKRWDNFLNFMKDMGPRVNKSFSIHRLNNNKGYSPANCVWATRGEQNLFRRQPKLRKGKTLRGVYKLPSGKYAAKISKLFLGKYKTAEEAAYIYNKFAIKLYGKNAAVNDVPQLVIKQLASKYKNLDKQLRGI